MKLDPMFQWGSEIENRCTETRLIYKQIYRFQIHNIVVIGLQKEKPGPVKNAISSRFNRDLLFTDITTVPWYLHDIRRRTDPCSDYQPG